MGTHTIDIDDAAAQDGAHPRLVKSTLGGAEPRRGTAPALSTAPGLAGTSGAARAPAPLHEEPERESVEEHATPPRRKPIPLIVGAMVALLLGGWGLRQWAFAHSHVSTDNA